MRKITLSVLMAAALLVMAVVPAAAAPANAPRPQVTTLKMGLLPILDVLPFYVAEQAGYFSDANLNVELIPVSSALERDQLVLAGEIDGMVNDLISTGIFNQDEVRIQVVAQARRAYADSPQFRILAAPDSGFTKPEDLKGVEIAISENSVIHYIAQRILENAGLSASDLEFRAEPNIAIRFQLLMEGTIKAACLPDPLGQAAIEGGAILIADDSSLVDTGFSQSVLSFRTSVIKDKPDAVTAFVDAWMHAAQDINDNPDAYRDLWLENTSVPDSVKDTYVLPPFPTFDITQPFAWDDTMNWLLEQKIIDNAASYEDSVNPYFIMALLPENGAGATTLGNASNGQQLFASNGCIGCHAVDSDMAIVGPSLLGLPERAGQRVPDLSAEQYIYQSIVDPSAYVVEGFQAGIMPSYSMLPDDSVNDLVAYLMTLN